MKHLFLGLIVFFNACSVYETPPESTAATATPVAAEPTVPVVDESEIASLENDEPQPDPSLWHDPVADQYWLIGGNGTTDYLMVLCIGEYRLASYYEILGAAVHGLRHDYPDSIEIWSSQPAYYDSNTMETYNFYVDLNTSEMKTATSDKIKALACIWDPEY